MTLEAPYKARIEAVLRSSQQALPLLADGNGQQLEAALLENLTIGRYFLSVINWERQPARCRLELNLRPGRYACWQRDAAGLATVHFGGHELSSNVDLARLDLEVPAGSFQVFVLSLVP